jgi:carbon monoxide dehydrogenase subunit G
VRISESLAATDLSLLGELGERPLELRAGPITIPFRCDFTTSDSGSGVRVHGVGVSPGAGFTLDVELQPSGDALNVEGDVHVSGTLAGLGQREVGLQVRRLLSQYLG